MQRHTFPELLYSTYAQLLLIRLFRTGNIEMEEANSILAVVLFGPASATTAKKQLDTATISPRLHRIPPSYFYSFCTLPT
jgi:hypothetical protein